MNNINIDFDSTSLSIATPTTTPTTTTTTTTTEATTTTTTPTTTSTSTTTTTGFTSSPSVCTEVVLTDTDPVRVVTSPNYPILYPNNYHCEFNITAPVGKIVVLIFDSLKVEYKPSCTEDYIQVENLSEVYGVKMCGTKLPTQPVRDILYSADNYLTMTFHTGPSVQLKGFKVYAVSSTPT
ncbi:hypothetical protein Pmani_000697 [Petrolisthes manimaculis]|uniref:CUB domain-containing protein n=1 Tax=Petrolisthes manimaculis TaxID=1843537 RepID=A0AAE1QLI3_9EUCA|nr:hypothetical protein Pmani_000697 [Petrolisthes manimaculis]